MRKPRPKPQYRFLKPDRKCNAHVWRCERTDKGMRRTCVNPGCGTSITDVAHTVSSSPVVGMASRNAFKQGMG